MLTISLAALLAATTPDGGPSVTAAWTRATPPGATAGAGYLIITGGATGDRLLAATTPIAPRTELHTMSMKGGVMTMRALEAGLVIPARGVVTLEPGGIHLMFLDLPKPIVEGAPIVVALRFEKAGTVNVELKVRPIGARGPAP